MDANQSITSLLLKNARAEAKAAGVSIPKLSTYCHKFTNPYYEVYDDKGTIIWQGEAYNASEAKAKAIGHLIDKHQKGAA